MQPLVDFEILSNKQLSNLCRKHGLLSFKQAAIYIQQLAYKRNQNKLEFSSLFNEQCGTCSTKHGFLKLLADENNFNKLKLKLCILKLNSKNTPKIEAILLNHKLVYIPEAHTYLQFENQNLDFTFPNSNFFNFKEDILTEIEISHTQIEDFKTRYHKTFLEKWLCENEQLKLSLNELWSIREQCIAALSAF
ncbi:MAG: hypothetical protein WAR77_12945 [Saprospiraceae bacterium]